jgi:hypothetical protein
MKSRKQLLAERRKKTANELKLKNRDLFVRRLLRRSGIFPAFDASEKECFRGYDVYVSDAFPMNQCIVGVVAGCSNCRDANVAFNQIQQGRKKDLAFKCRIATKKPKLWIIHPEETPFKGPDLVYRVSRKKPLVDAHGHVIEPPRIPGNRPPGHVTTSSIGIAPQTTPIVMLPALDDDVSWMQSPTPVSRGSIVNFINMIPDTNYQIAMQDAFSDGRLGIQGLGGIWHLICFQGGMPAIVLRMEGIV